MQLSFGGREVGREGEVDMMGRKHVFMWHQYGGGDGGGGGGGGYCTFSMDKKAITKQILNV